jgi:hypothetical protein
MRQGKISHIRFNQEIIMARVGVGERCNDGHFPVIMRSRFDAKRKDRFCMPVLFEYYHQKRVSTSEGIPPAPEPTIFDENS